MKKRRFLIPLLVILCLLCMLALVACEETSADGDIAQTEQNGAGDNTPSAHVHAFGDWSVTTPASCVAAGEEARTCSCGAEETHTIAATGVHTFTAKSTDAAYVQTAPTCQSVGVYYYKCATCDAKGTETYRGNTKHTLGSDHICLGCSRAYMYFGEYPQTVKAEDVTVSETQRDTRGYYLGSDNAYYAKVTADPFENGYKFSDGSTVTNGTVYYFKVEPILWRILSQSDGKALILCDSIIANKAFDEGDLSDCSNNYIDSDIRAWLNNQFYNMAFTALERELILITAVDNSVASTGDDSNPYACDDTNDKVFCFLIPRQRAAVTI